jgi:glutamate-1-semialdehyde 2,1-aminomutase
MGDALRAGIQEQAERRGVEIVQTGPSQMPFLSFVGDVDWSIASQFAAAALRHGLYLHPRHNWFISAALTDADLDRALSATDAAFGELRSPRL